MLPAGERTALIPTLDAYCDAAPRTACRPEVIGPFTLFVNDGAGWEYYARPTPGAWDFNPADVEGVRDRQRQLGISEAFEWIADATPSLGPVARQAGLAVAWHPLMVLGADRRKHDPPPGVSLRLAQSDDDLAMGAAVARLAFTSPGTAVGPVGLEALAASFRRRERGMSTFERSRLDRGVTITVIAESGGLPVAVGSHQPVGHVTELAGIGTLPAFRRQGIGSSITSFLVGHALGMGIATCFMVAGDEEIARVYAGVGFERVGTSCTAEPVGA